MIPKKGTQEYIDYVMRLSARGVLRQGVINEPRCYFDEIVVNPTGQETAGSPGVFVNGEQFPVRLKYLTACTRFLNNATPPTPDNPINIQQIALRLAFHNQFYMNSLFLPVPLWGNKLVAGPDPIATALSHWDFVANGQPFVLSSRDTLQVAVALRAAPVAPIPITVAFTGFGMLSNRPYLLNGQATLATAAPTILNTTDFRNDGSEPIIITDMTVNVRSGDDLLRGDINILSLNVKQFGNGTNADWFVGPQVPTPLQRMQATLLGVTTGSAVVHEFPGDGLLWEPGEGITLMAQTFPGGGATPPQGFDSVLCLAFAGYIMVT